VEENDMRQQGARAERSTIHCALSEAQAIVCAALIIGLGITRSVAAAPHDPPSLAPPISQSSDQPGTFAVETYACPPGMDLQTLEPDECAASPEPLIEWRLTSDRFATPLVQADAEVDGATVTWRGLPDGEYFLDLTAEVYFYGHKDYFIPSSNEVTRQDEHTTRIFYRSDPPHESINAYVFSPGGVATGSGIVASIHNCPRDTVLADIQVEPCDEPVDSGQVRVVCDHQGAVVKLDRANRLDQLSLGNSFPLGTCSLNVGDLPDGHDLAYVFGGGNAGVTGEDELFEFALDETSIDDDGVLHLTIFFVDASTPDDRDGDGLSNSAEEELGTDPENADTDGDGTGDFNEVRFGSDPLDPTSEPA
jgi:hypothetical protein